MTRWNKGIALFQQGNFEEAAVIWDDAARAYEAAGEPRKQNQALINLAQAYHQLGTASKGLRSRSNSRLTSRSK